MGTDENDEEVSCHHCEKKVFKRDTRLVMAQGLMMPNVPEFKGSDGRFGFAILLRVCSDCNSNLHTAPESFKRQLRFEGFACQDLTIFHAGADDKGYYVRRFVVACYLPAFTLVDLGGASELTFMYEPRGFFLGREYLDIREENTYHY